MNDGPRYKQVAIEATLVVYIPESSTGEDSTKTLAETFLGEVLNTWKKEGYFEGWPDELTVSRSKVQAGFYCGCGTKLVHTPSKNWCTKCQERKEKSD